MNYYKEYMVSVCAILVLSTVCSEILVNFSWSKYINLICGILFAVCLFNPIMKLFHLNFDFDTEVTTDQGRDFISVTLEDEFSKVLSKEIISDVKENFNVDANLKAELYDNSKIVIYFYTPVKEYVYDYIKEKYKPYKIHILGG